MSSSQPTERLTPQAPRPARVGFLPSTLTGRLALTTIALVAVVSIGVAAVTTLALRSFLLQRLDDQLQSAVDRSVGVFYGPDAEAYLCRSGPRGPTSRIPGQGPGALDGVLDGRCPHAQVITDSGRPEVVSDGGLAALAGVSPDAEPHSVRLPGLGTYRVVVRQARGVTLVTGLPTSGVDATVGRLIGWEALVALIGVGLAAIAGRTLVRRQLRPLREVAATAAAVTSTPLDTGAVGTTARVPEEYTHPDNEVGQLGEALNLMLGHVERALDARHESEQQVRQFLADASHELRTPLSTIAGYAELSRRPASGAGEDEQIAALRHAMGRVDVESIRMTALVDDLLLLARLDAGRPLESQPVDLSRLAVEALNDIRVLAPDHRWLLAIPDEPVLVLGDDHRLHQVVANLLSNARRHTPPGTEVSLEITVQDGSAVLAIHDDGPGLPSALKERAFERFTRGDSSRTRDTGGSGLGLPIVQAIVDAHRGTVSVQSVPGDTTFRVQVPLVEGDLAAGGNQV